jgi:hypothetical protein
MMTSPLFSFNFCNPSFVTEAREEAAAAGRRAREAAIKGLKQEDLSAITEESKIFSDEFLSIEELALRALEAESVAVKAHKEKDPNAHKLFDAAGYLKEKALQKKRFFVRVFDEKVGATNPDLEALNTQARILNKPICILAARARFSDQKSRAFAATFWAFVTEARAQKARNADAARIKNTFSDLEKFFAASPEETLSRPKAEVEKNPQMHIAEVFSPGSSTSDLATLAADLLSPLKLSQTALDVSQGTDAKESGTNFKGLS